MLSPSGRSRRISAGNAAPIGTMPAAADVLCPVTDAGSTRARSIAIAARNRCRMRNSLVQATQCRDLVALFVGRPSEQSAYNGRRIEEFRGVREAERAERRPA